MADLKTESVETFSQPVRDDEIAREHRQWMNEQIERTLAKKERGDLTYTSLDEVRRAFGLDAS